MTQPPPFKIWHLFSITLILALFSVLTILLIQHRPRTELETAGTVQTVETLSTGNSVVVVCNPMGDETIIVFESTRLSLKSDIKSLVGHDVLVCGYRQDGKIIATSISELDDEPPADSPSPALAPPATEIILTPEFK
jgi:hypothetical protein